MNRQQPLFRVWPSLVSTLVLSLLLAVPAVRADSDHDRARNAVRAGQVLPLDRVLDRLAFEHPGQVLEVELDDEDGRWVYEIRLLQAGGRRVKLKVDAASGEVLGQRERKRDRDGDRRH